MAFSPPLHPTFPCHRPWVLFLPCCDTLPSIYRRQIWQCSEMGAIIHQIGTLVCKWRRLETTGAETLSVELGMVWSPRKAPENSAGLVCKPDAGLLYLIFWVVCSVSFHLLSYSSLHPHQCSEHSCNPLNSGLLSGAYGKKCLSLKDPWSAETRKKQWTLFLHGWEIPWGWVTMSRGQCSVVLISAMF